MKRRGTSHRELGNAIGSVFYKVRDTVPCVRAKAEILFCGGEAAAKKIESRRPTLLVFEEGWLRAKTKGTRHKNYKSFDSIEIPMSKFYFDIQGNNHCKQKSLWFLFT